MDKFGTFSGGNFWDGRATGEILGSPAAEQAKGPFLNPMEQALPNAAALVNLVCTSPAYGEMFTADLGRRDLRPRNVAQAYNAIGYTIAAYEASPEVNAFSSKFDASFGGGARLTQLERKGMALFVGKGKCAACHTLRGPGSLFTDYTYDNLGLPKNPENPVYTPTPPLSIRAWAASWPRAPTMPPMRRPTWASTRCRRCATSAWACRASSRPTATTATSRRWRASSTSTTRVMSSRCARVTTRRSRRWPPSCWPAPEVAANVNTAELGNLGLSPAEEAAIVAFLKTL